LGIQPNFENYTGDDLIETPGCGRGGSAGGRGGLGYGGGFGLVGISLPSRQRKSHHRPM
jgi:hypothetical protein